MFPMSRLNLKHLRYFWTVVSEGTIGRAAEQLNLTPQTISGQLKLLEESIGDELFEKSGRNIVPTATGRMVFSYANELFHIEDELNQVLDRGGLSQARQLRVGVAMVVPKLLAYRMLAPVMLSDEDIQLLCHEAPLEELLADLAIHKLDLVITDAPLNPALNIRAFNHELGASPTSFFATEDRAEALAEDFPRSLDGVDMLMPSASSALRRSLEKWFSDVGVRPKVVAEFEDRALMKAFGEAGAGVFSSPTVVREDVESKYKVRDIGSVDAVRETFYAITAERRATHPAVISITERARQGLFNIVQ